MSISTRTWNRAQRESVDIRTCRTDDEANYRIDLIVGAARHQQRAHRLTSKDVRRLRTRMVVGEYVQRWWQMGEFHQHAHGVDYLTAL